MFNWLKKNGQTSIRRRWLIVATSLLAVILICLGIIVAYQKAYAEKFFPGTEIAYIDLSGKNKEQVLDELKAIEKNIQDKGFHFSYGDKDVVINPIIVSATDPDLAKPILSFDWQKTITPAFEAGRSGNLWQNILTQIKLSVFGQEFPVSYRLDKEEFLASLKVSFSEFEKQPVNARLEITNGKAEIVGESSGYIFTYEQAADQLEQNIKDLNFEPIVLSLVFQEPEIKKEYAGSALNSLDNILAIGSINLVYENKNWSIDKDTFSDWLEFQMVEGQIVIGFNQETAVKKLTEISKEIDIAAIDARFELEGKRVREFQASKDGLKLNIEESYKKLNDQILAGDSKDVELVVEVSPAKVATGELNDLGIKDLLGRGTSNFSGSPKNRRHNISVGASSLDGILIAPDEEFSLIEALGDIDGENGYLQELVIKGNRTIPEYGGGLCQIGTTTFRAALNAGLPITQRRNHSYRVVYYEPAGTDATIYDPWPDFRFKNDTGHHILFVAKLNGDEAIFEFYGTDDGRKVVVTPDPPRIYNITSPGEPKYVETKELAPGEKKKVESAHNGADTYFEYIVTYPDGEVVTEEFTSHYVAWPEVWLVGIDPEAQKEEELSEEETDSIIEEISGQQ